MSDALEIGAVRAALEGKIDELKDALLQKVAANLSGDVLRSRSGTLKASIVAESSIGADAMSVTLASRGVPYAAIQEYGGDTAAHDIVPVKARALAFAGAAGQVFARSVHHPGSRIPARPYLGGALDALHGEIVGGLKETIVSALQGD